MASSTPTISQRGPLSESLNALPNMRPGCPAAGRSEQRALGRFALELAEVAGGTQRGQSL
jgi:hypothetical protein